MKIINMRRFVSHSAFVALLLFTTTVSAQLKLGDNMGSHVATKDLEMGSHNIKAANLINAKGILIGTATTLSNTSIALQVDGADKAILVPRVTDLLNATTPSIPVANAVNGMIVYDLATAKFYHRQNNAWVVYVDAVNYVDRYLPQVILGRKTFKSDSGFVALGTFGAGIIPVTGAGTRMMWYPKKGAFRAGTTGATQWEDGVIGNYSVAMGQNGQASGIGAVAIGTTATASADYSTAIGRSVTASGIGAMALGSFISTGTNAGSFVLGDNSVSTIMGTTVSNRFTARFAGGYRFYTSADTTKGFFATPGGVLKYKDDYTALYDARSIVDKAYLDSHYAPKSTATSGAAPTATGDNSFAIGRGTQALALNSFAYGGETKATGNETMAGGIRTTASGLHSVALGRDNTASGTVSFAIGTNATATGEASFAIGSYVSTTRTNSTEAMIGAFSIGDASTTNALTPSKANEMNMRFAGGYRLYSASTYDHGMFITAGGDSWSAFSDRRRKENFETIDAESFLLKIDTMNVGSWNYKKQDPKTFRHYGPMAQDFYGAFGKDSYGTIGCDTLIASTDFDGVNLIAIKGLVKRTNDLMMNNTALVKRTNDLTVENDALKQKIAALETINKDALVVLERKFELLSEEVKQNRKTETMHVAVK